MKWKTSILILIFYLVGNSFTPLFSADIEITSTVSSTKIGLNSTFNLSIQITGEKANNTGDPQVPDLSNFAVYRGSTGTSQNIQIINGRMSVSKSMSFTYMATVLGKFTIPPAILKFDGKEYKTKPIKIEVFKAKTQQTQRLQRGRQGARNQNAPKQNQITKENLYLKVSVNKRKVYVNEPVILTYKIYTNVTVTQYGVNKLPNTTGFWVEEFPMGNQPKTTEEIINGQKYIVAEIKRTSLFPTDAGTKTIGPMEIECNVRVQTQRRSIFDSFFDDPFFGRSVRRSITSKPVTIEVLPMPKEGRSKNFSGLAGKFKISASVDKKAVKTNEAIALKVRISGSGNVKMIPMPQINIPTDFETYEPKVTERINRKQRSISGSKTFEYVLIARKPGLQKIKPVLFSYFDTNTKKYKTIRTPEINVNVEKGSDEFMIVTTGLSKEEVKLVGKDIRFIQQGVSQFQRTGFFFYKSYYFIFIILIPFILIISAFGYRRHLDKLSGNLAYARSRKANQIAMKHLHKAKKLLSEKTQKDFYAEVSNSLMGFLGNKLNIASAGIITDKVEHLMKSRNIDEQVISKYLNCLQVCDYQRFAPSSAKIENMKQFFNQVKQAIIELEKVI